MYDNISVTDPYNISVPYLYSITAADRSVYTTCMQHVFFQVCNEWYGL